MTSRRCAVTAGGWRTRWQSPARRLQYRDSSRDSWAELVRGETRICGLALRLVQRPQRLLPGLRAAGRRPGHRVRSLVGDGGGGVLVRDREQAAAAIGELRVDYPCHRRAARELAETCSTQITCSRSCWNVCENSDLVAALQISLRRPIGRGCAGRALGLLVQRTDRGADRRRLSADAVQEPRRAQPLGARVRRRPAARDRGLRPPPDGLDAPACIGWQTTQARAWLFLERLDAVPSVAGGGGGAWLAAARYSRACIASARPPARAGC